MRDRSIVRRLHRSVRIDRSCMRHVILPGASRRRCLALALAGILALPLSVTAANAPNRLVVTRTKNVTNNPTSASFEKTIADSSTVQKLYADIRALPPFPNGPISCPLDTGLSYRLKFFANDTLLLSADYEPSGCRKVTLSDGAKKTAMKSHVNDDLGSALGLSEKQLQGLE
jgi:hypothetical protein